MADHNYFGKKCEELAAEFLAKNGYKILARNFRYLKAEVDIIAEVGAETVFVEVKARNSTKIMEPHEAVTNKKIRLLISAADEFMSSRVGEARFDIIAVAPVNGVLEINHIRDAFNAADL